MELKFKGIITNLTDYKDADKLASVFTYENGLTTIKFVGVKKEKAKMKSVAQPFTFAEFVASQKGIYKTVISSDIIDGFNGILIDYNKTICAYCVLDMVNNLIVKEKQEENLFILTLDALKNIENKNPYVSLVDYVLKFFSFLGMDIQILDGDYVYLDKLSGDFVASRSANCTAIDKKVYKTLKDVKNSTIEEINENTLKQCLRLLHNIILLKFDEDIKSFQFI